MGLADDIRRLAVNLLSGLDAAHDYYTFSRRVWGFVEKKVSQGERFTFVNPSTGRRISQDELATLGEEYVETYLRSAAFQTFVSLFEDFVFDPLRLWLSAYPGSLSRKQVELGAVLRAGDVAAVARVVIDKEINELKYERVSNWFEYLNRLVSVGSPSADEVERLAEMKASRDILVHNQGVANPIYEQKAGRLARHRSGERLELPEAYLRESSRLIKKVIGDVSEAAANKG